MSVVPLHEHVGQAATDSCPKSNKTRIGRVFQACGADGVAANAAPSDHDDVSRQRRRSTLRVALDSSALTRHRPTEIALKQHCHAGGRGVESSRA